jgi:hypothetical protein
MTAPTSEIRTADEVARWLAGGLRLRRMAAATDDDPVAWLAAAAAELPSLPPPGVIADLGALLGGVRPAPPALPTDDSIRAAVRAYDDDVLGRLAADPRLDDAIAAIAHLPAGARAGAIALVAGGLVQRTGFTGVSASPAALRRALTRPADELDELGRDVLHAGDPALALLADGYAALARGARQVRELIGERELFALTHVDLIASLGRRLALAQIAEAGEALAATLPRRLRRNPQRRGDHVTKLDDDATYPVGGFTAIAPGGATDAVEGVVSSELAYMEEDDHGEADLFDLRWVEGQLLRYTRDEGELLRRRHVITVALAADLEGARVKDRGAPWQRLVLALGLVVGLTRWLAEQLGDQALHVRVAVPPGALAEDAALLGLLLADELERGVASVVALDVPAAMARAAADRGALVDVIVIGRGPAPPAPRDLRLIELQINQAEPALINRARPAVAEDEAAAADPVTPWEAWCAIAGELVRWLV